MDMLQKLYAPEPTLSCEYFPPKNPSGWGTLYATLAAAQELKLDFASVTYGAGGSTREKTLSLVERLQNELTIDAMAHLTCVGHSQAELDIILTQLKADGIPAVMALRGDPPQGSHHFSPHAGGFSYATDLITFIRSRYDFKIGCASYPEGHIESASMQQDIIFLKQKQDCGADFTVTQLFFDNDDFYRFRDAARAAGVTMPIIAGIMPVTAVKQLDRFQTLCGCTIPRKLSNLLLADTETSIVERGIIYGIAQVQDLLDHDVDG
ncbi:MAG: methylenetetrahydrofolate reductase, partial [Anaerolineae bacterium]|nr:methylenetetrahydrofolate reductase [Anaerolineae bacterium]